MQNPLKKNVRSRKSVSLASFIAVFLQLAAYGAKSAIAKPSCDVAPSLSSVGSSIAQHLDQPHLKRTRWGVDIRQVSASNPEPQKIYQKSATQLFLPASTAKLFTTAALVESFTPDYRIETPYFAAGQPPHLDELRIQGTGDPSILDPQLEQIAQQLKSQGIKKIGTLIGDSRNFQYPAIIASWEWQDLQSSDGVPITSLSFSQNSLPLQLSPQDIGQPLQPQWLNGQLSSLKVLNQSQTVTAKDPEFIVLDRSLAGDTLTIRGQLQAGAAPDVSYVAIAKPEAYFLLRLQQALNEKGIKVKRLQVQDPDSADLDTSTTKSQGTSLGKLTSPPLTELLQEINQSSNNFYTESLLRHWAWSQLQSPEATVSASQSIDMLEDALQKLGINPEGYQLKDASGLSRHNLVSPESLTTTLAAALKWQALSPGSNTLPGKFETFRESLAIAGQSGTLQSRFQGTPVAGKLWAKTGTLSGTVALAGFLEEPGRPTLILTVLANHSDQSIATLRKTIDEIIVMLHHAQVCSSNGVD